MNEIRDILDAYDLVVARAVGVVSDEEVVAGRVLAESVRRRQGFLGDTLVMALVGGTGVGKSSLLNAIAGEEVSSTSPIRPHTDEALAWVPATAGPSFATVLDGMNITRRVYHDSFPGVAFVDLPDMDSVVESHKASVEAILPRVDAVLWVFDPDKYNDPDLHESFLRPLAPYQPQMHFVLNKVDLLPISSRDIVIDDLKSVLGEDGFVEPTVLVTAAEPETGPPFGIDSLRRFLSETIDAKRTAMGKILGDLATRTRAMATAAGVWDGGSVSFGERWARVVESAADSIRPEADPAAVEDARCRIEDFVAVVAAEAGGSTGEQIRQTFDANRIAVALSAASEVAAGFQAVPKRPGRLQPENPAASAVSAELEKHVGLPLRTALVPRAEFGGAVASLGVALAHGLAHLSRTVESVGDPSREDFEGM